MERDSFAVRIREMKFAAETRDGKLGILVGAMCSLNGHVAAAEDKASTGGLELVNAGKYVLTSCTCPKTGLDRLC